MLDSILQAVLLSFIVASASGTAQANTVFAGNIKLIEGVTESEYVKIIRPGFTKILAGKPGDAIFEGDTIKTDKGVKVQIELSDQTIISIAPNGNLQIAGYMAERPVARRNTVFKVMKGTMRFIISKLFKSDGSGERSWKDSAVTIETLNAVAGVRGTDFFTVIGEADVEFSVIDGVVGVRSARPGGNGEVLVGANQMSITKMGGKPGRPEALSAGRRELLLRMTTLDKAMSLMNDKLDKALTKKKKYDKNAIKRDLAAGKPLSTVIDNAVASGMPIGEVICATIDAGVNPGIVVYTCIQEGYSASKVVETAITCGVAPNVVFISAVSAGADQQAVITGAEGAGMPPATIAGTLTNATVMDLVTISTIVAAIPVTPSTVLPPVVVPIGGGGGTPSASPYVP
ncbi:MAG: FecR family protein [Nitrospirota bacterium]|nr:FecR family protein [Nitrospirota bacterium]